MSDRASTGRADGGVDPGLFILLPGIVYKYESSWNIMDLGAREGGAEDRPTVGTVGACCATAWLHSRFCSRRRLHASVQGLHACVRSQRYPKQSSSIWMVRCTIRPLYNETRITSRPGLLIAHVLVCHRLPLGSRHVHAVGWRSTL